ncbi:GNAT family N-acetyltransferase [Streptomyces sp. NPDC057302]|uniref:GNAT family N-acetyltransferase n=1 Tax=Streptomyces sp. NPDC057302 TaxID=3346094 RepID=UPI003638D68A
MPPPPPDASTDAGTETTPESATESSSADRADVQDTLDLRLPDELIALFGATSGPTSGARSGAADAQTDAHGERPAHAGHIGSVTPRPPGRAPAPSAASSADDLLDNVADWGPATTSAGVFQLVPVRIERDLPLISRWMNDPAVAAFWDLAGPDDVTQAHLRDQIDGDGRSVPCLGVLDDTPMSYWEVYRADLDALARHYPARPHDTGLHLLIGGVADRGRGLGTSLLRAVADLVLDHRAACARVIAEPALRNTPSVSAFLSAGFRFAAEVDLPDKRAALMVRDRALRAVL